MQKWKKVSSKVLYRHPRLTLIEDRVELPDGTVVPYLKFSGNKSAAACVIAIENDKVLLQREYSYPPNEVLYQFPGGAVEGGGEKPAVAANRELMEESGYTAGKLELLGWYYVDNRRTDTKMYVFLATRVTPCQQTGGDLEEYIESSWLPIQSIARLIAQGKTPNYSLLSAWALFMARQ